MGAYISAHYFLYPFSISFFVLIGISCGFLDSGMAFSKLIVNTPSANIASLISIVSANFHSVSKARDAIPLCIYSPSCLS